MVAEKGKCLIKGCGGKPVLARGPLRSDLRALIGPQIMERAAMAANGVVEVRIADVKIGERHRKDMGDLESLAASIEDVGLLQPIGISETKELVFGERRLKAVSQILRQPTIAARIVKVPSILHGEYHENEIRKDFSVSERVAIAAALKDEVSARAKERMHSGKSQDPGENFNQGPVRTAEVVAQRAGFGNENTFRQAEKVVQKGHVDLVKAMDEGTVSISAAARIAELPKPEQKMAMAKPAKKKKASRHNAKKPADCTEIISLLDEAGDAITAARQKVEATKGSFDSHKFDLKEQVGRLSMARKLLSQVRASVKGE